MTGNETTLCQTLHPMYRDSLQDWTLWRDVYKSGTNFVNRYLEPFSVRETVAQFNTRKKLTPPPAFAKSAILEIVNNIFQRMPDITRANGSESYMNCLDGLNGGVDLIGSSMNYFMGMTILPELLVIRRVGIYVDMPDASGTTLLEAKTRNIRPYMYRYLAEEILNWTLDATNSDNEFSSILLSEEYVVKDLKWGLPVDRDTRYRRMWIGDDGFVHAQYYDSNEVPIDANGVQGGEEIILPLTKIPFVILEIPHSLLEDAALYQVALLNMNSADVAYCIYSNVPFYTEQRDDRAATPYFRNSSDGTASNGGSDKEIQVGTTTGRSYPIGTERPGFIAPPTEPLVASMKKQETFELAIRKLVNLSVIQLGQVQASAESKMMDNSGLEAGLSAIGIEMERGERKTGEFWSMYESVDPPTVHYPLRYSLKSDSERRDEAKSLTGLAPQYPSKTMRKEVVKLAARTLMSSKISKPTMQAIEAEIEASEIVNTDPETILAQIEAGVLDKKNGAKALQLPENAVDVANQEHADRLATIAMHQSKDLPGARGVSDAAGANNQGSTEKQIPGASKGGEPPVTRS